MPEQRRTSYQRHKKQLRKPTLNGTRCTYLEGRLRLRRRSLGNEVLVRVTHARGGHDRLDERDRFRALLPGHHLFAAAGGGVVVLCIVACALRCARERTRAVLHFGH